MTCFENVKGLPIALGLVGAINENRAYLSEIDGLIGDGDHGVNMSKGFSLFAERAQGQDMDFSTAMRTLSRTLLGDIGGSMGPLYGTFFGEIAKKTRGAERIDAALVGTMLRAALEAVQELGGAQPGDKTLIDTLDPAVRAYEQALSEGHDLQESLTRMKAAAEQGRDSTKDMIARIGRASRLGERSKGVLDAGATSCCILLKALAEGIIAQGQ